MKHRNVMLQKERQARSKAAKLVHRYPLIKGALVVSERTCGKPGCKCTRGEKHLTCYLSVRYKGKREMIYVPKEWEDRIQTWVKTYKEGMKLIDVISDSSLNRLIKAKKAKRDKRADR